MTNQGFLPRKGDYKNLLSCQRAAIVYECTCAFRKRFLENLDRTIDQMVQAARSGKQNIIEGAKGAVASTVPFLDLSIGQVIPSGPFP